MTTPLTICADCLWPIAECVCVDDTDPCVTACFDTGECRGTCGLSRGAA